MNKIIVSLFILSIWPAVGLSYTPSIESLLRNSMNPDIGSGTVVATMTIERVVKPEESELNNIPTKTAIKILIGNEENERPKLIQVDYRDGIISKSTMNKIHYKNHFNFETMGLKNENHAELMSFYSVLFTLLTNNSKPMMEFYKTINPEVKGNKALVNKDQDSLLRQYKYYLSKMAVNESQTEVSNPLIGESEENKKRINEILNASYLIKDNQIVRTFEKKRFYWDFIVNKLFARFDGEDHKLKKVTAEVGTEKIEIDLYNYILFNGKVEFPEIIYFKDLNGQRYEIKMKNISIIQDSPGSFAKRLKEYEKELSEVDERNSEIIKPVFTL